MKDSSNPVKRFCFAPKMKRRATPVLPDEIGRRSGKLLMDAKNFGTPVKAKDADQLMLSASRFDAFPDIWVTSGDFKAPKN
jgi:hypothetical protein